MIDKNSVAEQEEQIRRQVRELPDEMRASYYRQVENQLKDPDTYATLNYIFIAGLHHFYLGNWPLGLMNIAVFTCGILLLVFGLIEIGIAFIIGIVLFELYELFRAQTLVQNHNNTVSQNIIRELLEESI